MKNGKENGKSDKGDHRTGDTVELLSRTASGAAAKMDEEVYEIVRMVLDRIEVIDQRYADVYFLDGTVMKVELESEYDWD